MPERTIAIPLSSQSTRGLFALFPSVKIPCLESFEQEETEGTEAVHPKTKKTNVFSEITTFQVFLSPSRALKKPLNFLPTDSSEEPYKWEAKSSVINAVSQVLHSNRHDFFGPGNENWIYWNRRDRGSDDHWFGQKRMDGDRFGFGKK